MLLTYGTSQLRACRIERSSSPARRCSCSAPRAASASPRWNGQGHGRARHRRRLDRSEARARARAGADEAMLYPAVPFDKTAASALTDHFKSACGANGAARHLRSGRRRLYGSGAARDRLGGTLPGRRLSAGIPKLPLNLTLAEELPDRRRLLGRVHRAPARAACRQCRGAHGTYLDGHQAGGHRALSAPRRGMDAIARLAAREARGKLVVMIE